MMQSDNQYTLILFDGGCIGKKYHSNDLDELKSFGMSQYAKQKITGFTLWQNHYHGFHEKLLVSVGSKS